MALPAGRTVPLSRARELMGDFCHFAQKVPHACVGRRMNLAEISAARTAADPKPSWFAIMTKAYAIALRRYPHLNRSYLTFPMRRLYEHAVSVAAVAVERELDSERAVLPLRIAEPENIPLAQLHAQISTAKTAPFETISSFREVLRLMKLPTLLRRFAWWLVLNVSGNWRQRLFGTFGVTGVSGRGGEVLYTFSPLTSVLSVDEVRADGSTMVRVFFDHRVLDGGPIVTALTEMEKILHAEILTELHSLAPATPLNRCA